MRRSSERVKKKGRSTDLQDAAEFSQPGELHVFGNVREYRYRKDKIEELNYERNAEHWLVDDEFCDQAQIFLSHCDSLAIDVRAEPFDGLA